MSTIWNEFLGQLVRKALVVLFGVLVSHAVISQDLAARFTNTYTGDIVVFLLVAIPIAWGYAKLRYNKLFARRALAAAPGTPAQEIKAAVLENNKGVTSI